MNNETGRNGHERGTNRRHGALICSSCDTMGDGSGTYCAWCGGALVRVCTGCNARVLQPVACYCTQCGASL